MPNWCDNTLTVSGPTSDVRAFLNVMSGPSLLNFDKLAPYPERFRKLDEAAEAWDNKRAEKRGKDPGPRPVDGFNNGGREWLLKNWGTKWPACGVRIEERKETADRLVVDIHFRTAWTPPRPVIHEAKRLFPTLDFVLRFIDEAREFEGELSLRNP